MSQAAATLRPLGLAEHGVRLLCTKTGSVDGIIQIYALGILIGELKQEAQIEEGETVDIPVHRFPRIDLPCELRIASSSALLEEDHLPLRSTSDVYLLVGAGEIDFRNYTIQDGYLLFVLTNTINGLWEPNVYIRMRLGQTRLCTIDHIGLLDEGGCVVNLRVAIHQTDLTASGFYTEIFSADRIGIIATIEYVAPQIDSVKPSIARLESQIYSGYSTQQLRLATFEKGISERLGAMEMRVEAFLEHILALTLDQLMRVDDQNPPANHATLDAISEKARQLLLQVRKAASGTDASLNALATSSHRLIDLAVDSEAFFQGWHYPEFDADRRMFRWMQPSGVIRLPLPAAAIQKIVIGILNHYKPVEPSLSAYINGHPATVHCFPVTIGYEALIFPTDIDTQHVGNAELYLDSKHWGCPAQEETSIDTRQLSFTVYRIQIESERN